MGRYAGNKAVMQLIIIIIDEVSGSSKMMKIKIQGFAQCLSMMWTDPNIVQCFFYLYNYIEID